MKSWNAWYGLFAFSILFGILPTVFGHSEGIRKTWQIHQSLVSQRRQTYLPSDPQTSDYRPGDGIDQEQTTQRIGLVLLSSGLILSLTTGIFDLRRRKLADFASSSTADPQIEETYPMASVLSVAGLVFFMAGVGFQITFLGQVLSGQPILVNGVPQAAGPGLKLVMTVFPVPFWGLGAYLLLLGQNFLLTVTPAGIRVRNALRKTWEADWTNLKIVFREPRGLRLSDGVHEVWVLNSIENSSELLALIDAKLG